MTTTRLCLIVIFSLLANPAGAADSKTPPASNDPSRPRILLQRDLAAIDEQTATLKREHDLLERRVKLIGDLLSEIQTLKLSPQLGDKIKDLSDAFARMGKKPSKSELRKFGDAAEELVSLFLDPVTAWVRKYSRGSGGPSLSTDERTYIRTLVTTINLDDLGPTHMTAYKAVIGQDKQASDPFPAAILLPVDAPTFNAFVAIFSESTLTEVKKPYVDLLTKARLDAQQRSDSLATQIKETEAKASALVADLAKKEEGQLQIDSKLISYVLPAFALIMLILFLAPLRFGTQDMQQLIFSSGLVLELVTVFLLAGTILILGVGGKIQPDVLGTLLGGISGYVLGRNLQSKAK